MGFWLNIAAQRSPQLVHSKFLTSEEGRNTAANWDRLSHIRRHYSIKFRGHYTVYLVIFVQGLSSHSARVSYCSRLHFADPSFHEWTTV